MPRPLSSPGLEDSPRADGTGVRTLFTRIAGVYDLLNTVFSFGLDALWRARLAGAVLPFPRNGTTHILDMAAGTLEVSLALAGRYPRCRILALDFCRPMLLRGLPKLTRRKIRTILPLVGDGRRLPLPDASVDAVTVAFGLRNIRPREQVYAEALRVLVPGGKLCVLEFGSARDRILFGLYNFYLARVLPFVGRYVSGSKDAYRYLSDSVAAYPGAAALAGEMRAAGFVGVRYEAVSAGIVCLHTGEKGPQGS